MKTLKVIFLLIFATFMLQNCSNEKSATTDTSSKINFVGEEPKTNNNQEMDEFSKKMLKKWIDFVYSEEFDNRSKEIYINNKKINGTIKDFLTYCKKNNDNMVLGLFFWDFYYDPDEYLQSSKKELIKKLEKSRRVYIDSQEAYEKYKKGNY